MNSITVVGNLVENAVVKEFDEDKYVLFKVADNLYMGEGKEHANFIDVKWKVKQAEKLLESLKRGAKVTVMGELVIRDVENNGQKYRNVGIRYPKVDLPPKGKSSQSNMDW
tara:strand:- start:406 stop:738 length:333 start_codon:yes stop_codon:yes gene_type:complete